MVCAAYKSHESIVRLCRDWGAHEIDRAMAYAAEEGHKSIVRLLGVTDVDLAMVRAVCNGHESIVRLCHDWGGEAFNATMPHTARYGHIGIVIPCCRWGATDLEWAMTMPQRGSRRNRAIVLHLGR